jgi:putative ABC transport system permease protein
VLAFAAGTAAATSIVFGLLPALASTGTAIARVISASRGAIGHSGARIRKALVVCEMALAVVLLVGAGLLIRSYQHISDVDPGFAPDHVLTFTIGLPEAKYPTGTAVTQFVQALVARLGAHAGVEHAAAVFGLPLDDHFSASSSFTKPGQTDTGDTPSVGMRIVTPGYFTAMKIAMKSGRDFDARDDGSSPEVVIVNEETARRYWPGEDPIGKQMRMSVRLTSEAKNGFKTIVGVVSGVKYGGLDIAPVPEAYIPHAQHPVSELTMVTRTAGDPLGLVPSARASLAALDREMPMSAIRTMDDVVGRSISQRRFLMTLLGAFAGIAVLLAAIGVYGVLAYVVSQRTQEIGLRLAIGAAPDDVVRLFLREGITLALIGLVAGLAGALAAGRALTTMLFGVTATDPVTFAGVAAALAIAAAGASYLPARRAARVDPMEALRAD